MSNIITLTRGDTLDYPFEIILNDKPYQLRNGDAVYFGVMDYDQKFEDALIKKVYTLSNVLYPSKVMIHLTSDETVDLLPGRYYYMIKLKLANGPIGQGQGEEKVITLRNKKNFIVYD